MSNTAELTHLIPHATTALRFVIRLEDRETERAGEKRQVTMRILQQAHRVEHINQLGALVNVTHEWRDVPVESE